MGQSQRHNYRAVSLELTYNLPKQFLGPRLNGLKISSGIMPEGSSPFESSHRSGLNSFGSLKKRSERPMYHWPIDM